jgi:carnitine O-acetyltransferase
MGRLSTEEFERTKRLVEEFQRPGGRGERLHNKLLARAQSRKNWLEDWWLKYAYLIYRCPLPVNISYYFLFDEKENRQSAGQVFTSPTLQGAFYIKGALDFKRLLDTQTLPVETMRGHVPLDMHQFERLFTTTRNPHKGLDTITVIPNPANYVVVLSNSQIYLLDVYHNNNPSKALTVEELQQQLERIREDSLRPSSEKGQALAALTASDRDEWAMWKEQLIRLSPQNRDNLDAIDRSLFVLSLDEECPADSDAAGKLCLAGNAGNRWWDKIFNLIVFRNGRGGLLGEHTPIDAPTAGMMADHITAWIQKNRDVTSPSSGLPSLPAPRKLRWEVSPQVEEAVQKALINYEKLASDVDYRILLFKTYGADWLKDKAKLSPDAYVQVAMQLAYYRITGTGTATYETGATRQFYHGRTETVRSFSQPSVEFTKAMQDASVPPSVKLAKLRSAVDYHSKVLMNEAVSGKGVDRHLLGLKLLAMEEEADQPLPELFNDKAYKESCTWRLSTSNMPGQTYISGFGPGTFDGYGVCYGTRKDLLQFSITSFHSCQETDSARFRDVLRGTLLDLGSLINGQSSKL